jgi:putative transposase
VQDAWRQQQAQVQVRRMCRLLAGSRSGYYEWRSRPPRAQADAAQQVPAKGQRYCAQGRGPYGTRRITPLVAQAGLQGSRRRIGRVLAQAG